MAVISLTPASSRILARATLATSQSNRDDAVSLGGLYPLSMAAYELDEYRIMAGWPTSLPPNDVHAITQISSEGEVLAFREVPAAVNLDALVRWISDEDDTYDDTTLVWTPYEPSFDATWETSVEYAPTFLEAYEYRVGQENFFANAINFDSDSQQHFWGNLDSVIGGAAGYTVLMVVNLHSVYGDTDHPFTGIWCPGLPTPDSDTFTEDPGNYMSVTLVGETLYLKTEQTANIKVLPIADLLSEPQPFYLAMCFGRPNTTIYAGRGTGSLRSATVFTGSESTPLSGNVVLGRSNGTRLNSADMSVLDLAIYGDKLSTDQVSAEVAKLVAVYGGDL